MRAVIRKRKTLVGLQSASGLEQVDRCFFVVADDSPYLYRLDMQGNLSGTTLLFELAAGNERIVKQAKPDLEAMCVVEWRGRRELLCFGSGSKTPTRDVCFRVDITDATTPQNVRRVELTVLYDTLRANMDIVGSQTLNIEGACCADDRLYLFQRGNISGRNTVMGFELNAFMEWLDSTGTANLTPQVTAYSLPGLGGRMAGFSAATVVQNSLIFAAAVEDTDNEIDDGAKLGSFIGQIQGDDLVWVVPVWQDNEIARVKIEGIAVVSAREDFVELVAVTDDDEGASEMLWIEVR